MSKRARTEEENQNQLKIKNKKQKEDLSHIELNTLNDLIEISNDLETWTEPEWGFPKGRRNPNEKNLKCALREFYEETGIVKNDLIVLNKLFPIQEIFFGTNGIKYKHIYYIAIYNSVDEIGLNKIQEDQLTEIGDIKWKSIDASLKLFRPYHEEKKKLLLSLHNFLISKL
jgi:8-oxo-dGTP pyrophosphatase MutT (NUDIX family)